MGIKKMGLCLLRFKLVAALTGTILLPMLVRAEGHAEASRERNNCDMVFYCQTIHVLDVYAKGSAVTKAQEAFTFALSKGELLVPNKRSILGDGTANYKLTGGLCSEERPGELLFNYFEARLFGGSRIVRFKDGTLRGSDVTHDDLTRVWFASCDRFDK